MNLSVIDLGNISFQGAFLKQIQTQQEVRLGIQPNRLFLCEHPHTITFSRQARVDNIVDKTLVKDKEIDFVMGVNRGGDITYHGPGQLVGYLIFNLREFGRDLGWFLDRIDELLIRILAKFNIEGHVRKGFRGVWVGSDKIASIGIGVDRWVSMHGFALNVNTDLSFFDKIKPCGLDCGMTSMQSLKDSVIEMGLVKEEIIKQLPAVFSYVASKEHSWR